MKYTKPKQQPAPMSPRERREAMRDDFARRVEAENKSRKPRAAK
jgi:hypothetical protein